MSNELENSRPAPDDSGFVEDWGHPDREFKANWVGMLSGLLKHDLHWREASGAEGEWAWNSPRKVDSPLGVLGLFVLRRSNVPQR
jgi:hypothetical protein